MNWTIPPENLALCSAGPWPATGSPACIITASGWTSAHQNDYRAWTSGCTKGPGHHEPEQSTRPAGENGVVVPGTAAGTVQLRASGQHPDGARAPAALVSKATVLLSGLHCQGRWPGPGTGHSLCRSPDESPGPVGQATPQSHRPVSQGQGH